MDEVMLVDPICDSGMEESGGVDEDNKGWKSLVDRRKRRRRGDG